MDFASVLSKSEPHQRTIIHLDMDCFYAQVEEIRDPTLRTVPLGIQQKNILVTCNYVAREYGITKLMLITEAKRLCPSLVLVKGEDLTPYRLMSQRIFEQLLNFTPGVEKLGFDENFMDVSALVALREQSSNMNPTPSGAGATLQDEDEGMDMPQVKGHIYPADGATLNACDCGCAQRLAIGSQIAQEIRSSLHSALGITCCAGISYNKLLAKLVGAQNKPNQQTVLVSTHAEQFMRELRDLHRITGIGQKTESLLLESGIANVEELQTCSMDFLRKKFGFETATKLKDLSFGRDSGLVRPTGKPKSIGLEDSCRPISVRTDVEERFRMLLMRLVEQVAEDGRIPIAIKVILRKFDSQKKTSHRETKQANILPSLFKSSSCTDTGGAKVMLVDGAQEKLLKIIMRLFERVVDLNKPFNITLIGLAFSKFQQRKVGSSSIANFLIKKTDLEVQSITSLTSEGIVEPVVAGGGGRGASANDSKLGAAAGRACISSLATSDETSFRSSPTTFQPSDQFYRRRTTAASPIPMLVDNGSESAATNSDFSDFSETEVEPSPKKSRIGRLLMAKRRCLGSSAVASESADVASPSKLRVCDLRLNSRDSEKDFPMSPCTSTSASSSNTNGNNINNNNTATVAPNSIGCLPTHRFRTIQPPSTLLSRMEGGAITRNGCLRSNAMASNFMRQLSSNSTASTSSLAASPLPSPMDEASISTPTTPSDAVPVASPLSTAFEIAATLSNAATTTTATITGSLANIPCPAGVDPQVFNELPLDVQNELIASWRSSLAAAAAAVANGNANSAGAVANTSQAASPTTGAAASGGAAQKNTLYRYFLRNK